MFDAVHPIFRGKSGPVNRGWSELWARYGRGLFNVEASIADVLAGGSASGALFLQGSAAMDAADQAEFVRLAMRRGVTAISVEVYAAAPCGGDGAGQIEAAEHWRSSCDRLFSGLVIGPVVGERCGAASGAELFARKPGRLGAAARLEGNRPCGRSREDRGMTWAADRLGNGVAPHFEPESFRDFAFQELQAAPPWRAGICWRPECQRAFEPARDWQIHCGAACAAATKAEMRKWGHRMALPMLIWRTVKYEQNDAGLIDLRRVSRRYVTQVQSAWLADRAARAGGEG